MVLQTSKAETSDVTLILKTAKAETTFAFANYEKGQQFMFGSYRCELY